MKPSPSDSPELMRARRPCDRRHAFGAPLVPDVKRSKYSAVSSTGSSRSGVPAYGARTCAYSGVSTSRRRPFATPRSRPSRRWTWRPSVTMSWQSVWVMSRASSAPRRVGLMPTTTVPVTAAAPSHMAYSGVLSNRTPTCGGAPSGSWSTRYAARAATASRYSPQVQASSSKRIAGASRSRRSRACTNSAIVGIRTPAATPGGPRRSSRADRCRRR